MIVSTSFSIWGKLCNSLISITLESSFQDGWKNLRDPLSYVTVNHMPRLQLCNVKFKVMQKKFHF